jgi:hypothetical protein
VTVVFDEADELAAGDGVVRVAFVPTDKLLAPRAGEMTMRLDGWAVAGEIAVKPTDTVIVDDPDHDTPCAGPAASHTSRPARRSSSAARTPRRRRGSSR